MADTLAGPPAHNETAVARSTWFMRPEEGTALTDGRARASEAGTICIRTTRVFDWCERSTAETFVLTDLAYPPDTSDIAGVECTVGTISCNEVRRTRYTDGITVSALRTQVTFDLAFIDGSGTTIPLDDLPVETQSRSRFFDESVLLCAPRETRVVCEIVGIGCRTAMAIVDDAPAIVVDLFVCQSIRAEAEVVIRVKVRDPLAPGKCRTCGTALDGLRHQTGGAERGPL